MPEQKANNDTTMLLVRMVTDNTAEGVTFSRPSVHNSPRSTVAMSCAARKHRDEIRVGVHQPEARDSRDQEQQRHREHVYPHRVHRRRHLVAEH